MMRRSLSVVAEMAAVVGEVPDPQWAETYVRGHSYDLLPRPRRLRPSVN